VAAATVEALRFRFYAGLLPLTVALPGTILAAWQLVLDIRNPEEKKRGLDLGTSAEAASREGTRRAFLYFGVILGYYALMCSEGFQPATLVFLVGFLRFLAGPGWLRTGIYTAAVFGVLQLLEYFLAVEMPEGFWSVGF
jgi:Tripartite tricarboxylate transporter TctB family